LVVVPELFLGSVESLRGRKASRTAACLVCTTPGARRRAFLEYSYPNRRKAMMRNPGLTRIAIALGLAAAVAAAGCGGDSKKVTNPPPAKEMDSPIMGHFQTYPHRFFAAGTFPYHCTVHTFMTASVTVNAGAPAGDSLASVAISGNAFTPGTLIIPVGGKVTWTNNDAVNHTVTSD